MAVLVNIVLIGMAGVWLFAHVIVKRRFRVLRERVPRAYQSSIAAPPEDGGATQLMGLAVDLLRKQHGCPAFDTLSAQEKHIVLPAYAIHQLPRWMTRYAMLWLWPADRAIVRQLRAIATSRPVQKQMHYGAIRRQLKLRTLGKG